MAIEPKLLSAWQKDPQSHQPEISEALKPHIDKAIQYYAQGSSRPAIRMRARTLAMGALKSYDPQKGAKFETHLMNQLKPLTRSLHEMSDVVRIPEQAKRQLADLNRTETDLLGELGREPLEEELAERMHVSTDYLKKLKRYGSVRVTEDPIVAQEPATPEKMLQDWVYDSLDPVDKQIMRWKLGYGGAKMLTNAEIARRLRLSPGAISQRASKIADMLERTASEHSA